MNGKKNIDDKLATLTFRIDKEAHIRIKKEICVKCTRRSCLSICPAENYSWDEKNNTLIFNYEGCLECGTCKLVCPSGAIDWSYPQRGFGVIYKYG